MKHLFQKPTEFLFLLLSTFIFFLLRFPSLFEPYWYGDEGVYQTIAYALSQGLSLYTGIWDNKPPLLYVIYYLLGGEQFYTRALSLIFGILAVITFFYLAKKLFKSFRPIFISTAFFTFFFAIPMFEGNIANAENFMLFPILLAGYLLNANRESKSSKDKFRAILISGILLGVASLFKLVAIFDVFAFGFFLILLSSQNSEITKLKTLFKKPHLFNAAKIIKPLVIGYYIPLLLASLYFLTKGALPAFLSAVLTNNVGYVALENQLLFPQGLLVGKIVILILFLLFFLMKRKNLDTSSSFILLWLMFSLFNAFFSNRPYTHYILVLLPAFSLTFGLLFITKNKLKFFLVIILLTISILILGTFRYIKPQKIIAYYANFTSYLSGQKDTRSYQAFFDSRTPAIYDVASYLSLHVKKNEKIFIWGDSPQLYYMTKTLPTGRYTVAYHMLATKNTLDESLKNLNTLKPRYVVLFDDQLKTPFSLTQYAQRATIQGVTIYEHTF